MALEHLTHTLPRVTELYHGTSDEKGLGPLEAVASLPPQGFLM